MNHLGSISRRRFLQLTTLVVAGAGITRAFAGNSSSVSADLDRFLSEIIPIDRRSLEFKEYVFETVTVDRTGQITTRDRHTARSTRQPLAPNLDLEMVYIPGGSFQQGSPPEEKGDFTGSERPTRPVTTEAFLLGKYPITQAQWQAIATLPRIDIDLHADPAFFTGENHPIEQVSWYEAIEFCKRLSRATGKDYRLPSESRWEYACRAGTTTPFHSGETITGTLANYFSILDPYAEEPQGNYRTLTTPVGDYLPNAFGLYDMHGNVGEWCADRWHRNYKKNPPADGTPWLAPDPRIHPRHRSARLVRGGSWGDEARHCRSANRTFCAPEKRYSVLGFRVMASLSE
jgi:formylglycine-generating enzyme required for sulfatase activity